MEALMELLLLLGCLAFAVLVFGGSATRPRSRTIVIVEDPEPADGGCGGFLLLLLFVVLLFSLLAAHA